MSEWKKVRFLDVVHLNPRISLEKGVEYPFVEMSNVVPCARKPEKDVFKKYLGGGTKFEQGDTIVARIEPCLQNGKGFQCSYKQGFGSTEFIVFRPVNINDLDCDFLYYYMGQQAIREAMAKTMVGASGRQRVNNKVFNDLQIYLPPLSTQHRIANILSRYDSLIENYQKQIKLLEEAAQRLYKEWFIDLRFPGHENTNIIDGVPEGWEMKKVADVVVFYDKMRKPLSSMQRQSMEKIYPYYGAASLMDYVDNYLFDGTYLLMGEDGTVISNEKYPMLQYVWGKFWVSNHAHVLQGKEPYSTEFIYMMLKQMTILDVVTGAAQPKISQGRLAAKEIIMPANELVKEYDKIVVPMIQKAKSLQSQIRLLTEARDRLLPKLMNGEITV